MKNGESRVRLPLVNEVSLVLVLQPVNQIANKGDDAQNNRQRNGDTKDPQANNVEHFARVIPEHPVCREDEH